MNDDLLWHYTDTRAMLGILESSGLWATNALFLNDSQELKFGVDLICKELISLEEELQESRSLPREARLGRSLTLSLFTKHLREYHSLENIEKAPYLACLSRARDDLNQWRGYGLNGVSLGFERTALVNMAEVACRTQPTKPQPVAYGENAREAANRNASIIHHMLDSRLARAEEGSADSATMDYNEALSHGVPAILLAPALKHAAFSSEQEVRLIHSEIDEKLKYRESPTGLTPYAVIPINLGSLKEIILGPGPNMDLRVGATRSLVKTCNLSHTKVSESLCPFRG